MIIQKRGQNKDFSDSKGLRSITTNRSSLKEIIKDAIQKEGTLTEIEGIRGKKEL